MAKNTLGVLAQGDRRFGAMTRNPWREEQGSSGSSAGPGAVPFYWDANRPLTTIRVGYFKAAFDQTERVTRNLGEQLCWRRLSH
ncbi:MAG: hypothetical protein ACRENP_21000 [Longimicrobiales bacterium]